MFAQLLLLAVGSLAVSSLLFFDFSHFGFTAMADASGGYLKARG